MLYRKIGDQAREENQRAWALGNQTQNYQRPAANRIDDGKRNQMLKLAREVYPDFNMGHCLEMLAERDNLMTSYATFHR